MMQLHADPQETETSGNEPAIRYEELAEQFWNREMSLTRAKTEGVKLNDGHWAVVLFLRDYYTKYGLPITARITARALNNHFSVQGGNKYLHRLFPGGPVTQGSRFACVRTPAYATDPSFGTSY